MRLQQSTEPFGPGLFQAHLQLRLNALSQILLIVLLVKDSWQIFEVVVPLL